MFNLISCTKGDISYRIQPTVEGHVVIRPDMSHPNLSTLGYYFYPTDGQAPYIYSPCDGAGNFEGMLPVGTYHVIATNVIASGAGFYGMDRHHTATVYDKNLSGYTPVSRSRSTLEEVTVGCDPIFTTLLDDPLEVAQDGTVRHEPTPRNLTHTVTLTFRLTGALSARVTALAGTLYGLYPSVQLFSGETLEADINQSPNIGVAFTTIQDEEQEEDEDPAIIRQARLNIFGICNPQGGTKYQNLMPLNIEVAGKNHSLSANLTDNLTDMLEHYQGTIPLDIPLEIELEIQPEDDGPEDDDIIVTATVKPWDPSGEQVEPV